MGFVDNITNICMDPLGVIFNFCLKSGGSEGVAERERLFSVRSDKKKRQSVSKLKKFIDPDADGTADAT